MRKQWQGWPSLLCVMEWLSHQPGHALKLEQQPCCAWHTRHLWRPPQHQCGAVQLKQRCYSWGWLQWWSLIHYYWPLSYQKWQCCACSWHVWGRLQVHHMLGQHCSALQMKDHGCLVLPPQ